MARVTAALFVTTALLAACGDGEDTTRPCPSGFKHCDDECVAANLPELGCAEDRCRPCPFLGHATSACSTLGMCVVGACDEGWSDCNGIAADGCETDLLSDVENCGQCRHNCNLLPLPGVDRMMCANSQCAILRCEKDRRDEDGLMSNGCEMKVEEGSGGAPEAGGAGGAAG